MDLKILESLSVRIKIKKRVAQLRHDALTGISPLKISAVFVYRNMYVTVLNVILDVIVHETVNTNNFMNKRSL